MKNHVKGYIEILADIVSNYFSLTPQPSHQQ